MANPVRIQIRRTGEYRLEGTNALGRTIVMDAPVPVGGTDEGVRPIEVMLMSLAGCSSMDVLSILDKQREDLRDFSVTVEGDRVNAVPAVFEAIRIHFHLHGDVALVKLQNAVKLSAEKYCSVGAMLEKAGISITWTCAVN